MPRDAVAGPHGEPADGLTPSAGPEADVRAPGMSLWIVSCCTFIFLLHVKIAAAAT